MSYARYRQDYHLPLAASRTNAAVLMSIPIPAGKTVIVYDLKAYMSTAGSAAGCALDLKFDGGSASATVTTGNSTGAKNSASTFPITFTGAASTGSRLEIVQNTTDSSGIGTAFLDMEKPFK